MFSKPLSETGINDEFAYKTSYMLATQHISHGSTPTNVSARLLEINSLRNIDRTAMYLIVQWGEKVELEDRPVAAVLKVTSNRTTIVMHYAQEALQSEYRWFCWRCPGDIKDILIAGGQELGLPPTNQESQRSRVVLFYNR